MSDPDSVITPRGGSTGLTDFALQGCNLRMISRRGEDFYARVKTGFWESSAHRELAVGAYIKSWNRPVRLDNYINKVSLQITNNGLELPGSGLINPVNNDSCNEYSGKICVHIGHIGLPHVASL